MHLRLHIISQKFIYFFINLYATDFRSTIHNGILTDRAFAKLKWEIASTYGGISFRRTRKNTAVVLDQPYHYNLRSNNSIKNILRILSMSLASLAKPYPDLVMQIRLTKAFR